LALAAVERHREAEIETGQLTCPGCAAAYPILGGVPRFVPLENYAASFGLEWRRHARTQYDSYTGLKLSETRFFEETRWPRDLSGQLVLEVGSGAGRFTEPAAATGALVVSLDYSQAVEVNYQANGGRPNVLILQASVYEMPFYPGTFDKLFCFGMLQHTPNPPQAFAALPPLLKPGGELVVDVYKRTFFATFLATKYYVRFLTRRLEPQRLYRFTRKWVDFWWPLCRVISKVPKIGNSLNWRLLVADYASYGLQGDLLKEWAYLDTFDMLSPRYDLPQTLGTVRRWFREAGLEGVEAHYGYNGIEGRGRIPDSSRMVRS
jgi:SAM-dependent methyltransferase